MRNPWDEIEHMRRQTIAAVKKQSSERRDEFALRVLDAFADQLLFTADPTVKLDFISKVVGLADALMMTLDGDERIRDEQA